MSVAAVAQDEAIVEEIGPVQLLTDTCKGQAYRILEGPWLVTEWLVNSGIFSNLPSFITNASANIKPFVQTEAFVFLAQDLAFLPQTAKTFFESAFNWVKDGASAGIDKVAETARNFFSSVGGLFADVVDSISLLNSLNITKLVLSAPIRALGNLGGMAFSANQVYNLTMEEPKAGDLKASDPAVNDAKQKLAQDRNWWDRAKFVSVFAINVLSLVGIVLGGSIPALLFTAIATSIFITRVASFYKGLQIQNLENKDIRVQTAEANLRA